MTMNDDFCGKRKGLVITSDASLFEGFLDVSIVDSLDKASDVLLGGDVSILIMDASIDETMFSSYEMCRVLRKKEISLDMWELRANISSVHEMIFKRYGGNGVISRDKASVCELLNKHGFFQSNDSAEGNTGGIIKNAEVKIYSPVNVDAEINGTGNVGLSPNEFDLIVGKLSLFVGPVAPMIVKDSVEALGKGGSKVTLGAVVRLALREVPESRQAEFSRMCKVN